MHFCLQIKQVISFEVSLQWTAKTDNIMCIFFFITTIYQLREGKMGRPVFNSMKQTPFTYPFLKKEFIYLMKQMFLTL